MSQPFVTKDMVVPWTKNCITPNPGEPGLPASPRAPRSPCKKMHETSRQKHDKNVLPHTDYQPITICSLPYKEIGCYVRSHATAKQTCCPKIWQENSVTISKLRISRLRNYGLFLIFMIFQLHLLNITSYSCMLVE